MDKLLEHISHYNFFNYIFPGALFLIYYNYINPVFCVFEMYDVIVLGLLSYYFGFLISRIGSLVVEPLCRRYGIIKFVDYKLYLKSVKNDVKLETLVEQNNVNRTLIALSLIGILVTIIIDIIEGRFSCIEYILLIVSILIVFFSYKKQNEYILKRIYANVRNESGK